MSSKPEASPSEPKPLASAHDMARWRAAADTAGFSSATIAPLPSDASFRRYARLEGGHTPALVMDAPAPQEDLARYSRVNRHLASMGLRVPVFFYEDVAAGLAVIEDFGTSTFTKALASGVSETELYLLGVEALVQLHKSPQAVQVDAPPFDMEHHMRDLALFADWFARTLLGEQPDEGLRSQYLAAWRACLADVAELRQTLVMKDYHVDNLMLTQPASRFNDAYQNTVTNTPYRLDQCGLLDFQDALIGPYAYDLASLLWDDRRNVSSFTQQACIAHYKGRMQGAIESTVLDQLDDMLRLMATQRHTKNLGIFARLSRRDGRHGYLEHIPRLQAYLSEAFKHPVFKDVEASMTALCPMWQTAKLAPPTE